MAREEKPVLLEAVENLATITLNRPAASNLLNEATYETLEAVLEQLE